MASGCRRRVDALEACGWAMQAVERDKVDGAASRVLAGRKRSGVAYKPYVRACVVAWQWLGWVT